MKVFEEGTHLMIPWFERPVIYDVRARPSQITSTSGSRDLQMVRCIVLHSLNSTASDTYLSIDLMHFTHRCPFLISVSMQFSPGCQILCYCCEFCKQSHKQSHKL